MLKPIKLESDLHSLSGFQAYLKSLGYEVATNREIPSEELLPLTRPDWNKQTQGCIVNYVFATKTEIASPPSPPVLSRFFDSMCTPISFEVGSMLKGQTVFIKNK